MQDKQTASLTKHSHSLLARSLPIYLSIYYNYNVYLYL